MFFGIDNKKVAVVALLNNPNDLYRFTYIETHKYPKVEEYINQNLGDLKKLFKSYGLEFVYIPELTHILTDSRFSDDAKYYAPWITPKRIAELQEIYISQIQTLNESFTNQSDKPALVNSEGTAITLDFSQFEDLKEAFTLLAEDAKHLAMEESSLSPKERARRYLDSQKSLFPDVEIEDLYKDRTDTDLQSQHDPVVGSFVTTHEKGSETISTLVIKDKNKPIITLPEYNNLEIRLRAPSFAIYILFLKHPEGIRLCDLPDYREEYLRYFTPIARKDRNGNIVANIDNTLGYGQSNQPITRIKEDIKEAFKFNQEYAQCYTINGRRNDLYSIEVARMGMVNLPDYD